METLFGKIIKATKEELFGLYIEREMYYIMDFCEYTARMESLGCLVKENGD